MECREVERGEMIERYVRGDLSERELDRLEEHVLACESCHEQLEDLSLLRAALAADESAEAEAELESSWAIPWRWVGLAAAAVVVLAVLFWVRQVQPPVPGGDRLAELAMVQPPPYEPKSLRTLDGGGERRFREAMVPYQEGRFAEAIPVLEEAVELAPDLVPARFYLGASYLLTGESRQAVDTLTRVIDSDNGSYGEWALWLRSKAHLDSGEVEAARRDLEAVIRLEGELEAQAQHLMNELSG
jgi:tetratricopeptide (TPR) repeat protein